MCMWWDGSGAALPDLGLGREYGMGFMSSSRTSIVVLNIAINHHRANLMN